MKQLAHVLLFAVIGASTFTLAPHVSQAQAPPAGTEIKIFVPWGPDGTLNPALQVRSRDSFPPPFQCQAGAISTSRPDAWRCGTDDPCFAPPLADPSAQSVTLACANGPWSGSVQLLTVQTPLRSFDDCKSTPTCRLPLDLSANPWAIELANGVRCTLFTGTISSLGGVGMTYGCANQDGTPAGLAGTATKGVDRSQPLWQVLYQAPGDYVLQQIGVLVAWW